MISEHFEEQAALYAFDLLEGDELRAFETELRTQSELQALVDELCTAAASWSLAAPAQNPPPHLKSRILNAIRTESAANAPLTAISKTAGVIPQKSSRPFFGSFLPWALAAGLAIVCGLLAYNRATLQTELASVRRQAKTEIAATQQHAKSELADLQQKATVAEQNLKEQLAALEQRDQFSQKEIADLRRQNDLAQVKIMMMTSQLDNYAKSVAVVVWDERKQTGMLKIHNMPMPKQDKDYQLWVIDSQHKLPVNAGVLKVDPSGVVTSTFEPNQHITKADKFAISIERKGGAPEHEGPIVLLSSN